MRLTKGLRALIDDGKGGVSVSAWARGGIYGKGLQYEAHWLDCDGAKVATSDGLHDTKREAIADLDAVVARMARVFTGAS